MIILFNLSLQNYKMILTVSKENMDLKYLRKHTVLDVVFCKFYITFVFLINYFSLDKYFLHI